MSTDPPRARPSPQGFDPWVLDAQYQPFPSFAEWARGCSLDTRRWERYAAEAASAKEAPPDVLRRALDIVKRAAAVDTGAIEGLYDVDAGFTITVAMQAAEWEQALAQKGERARALIEAQMNAYDHVLDLATQAVPISEAWLRELHRDLCGSQATYTALTEVGWQEIPLPHGEYKRLPNHVIGRDGNPHAFAPVDRVSVEMHRLCEEFRSEAFLAAHPLCQASFGHYAFVVVHPFADGNGRVARALGSIFTYRAVSVPLLILDEHKGGYLSALEAADHGDSRPFVDFIAERTFDAIDLVRESLATAQLPSAEEAADHLQRLFLTRGGYTHHDVDGAGYRFQELLRDEVVKQFNALRGKFLKVDARFDNNGYRPRSPTHRIPVKDGCRTLYLVFSSPAPAEARVERQLALEVPLDATPDGSIRLWDPVDPNRSFEARISDLLPSPTASLQLRLRVIAEGLLRGAVSEVQRHAEENWRQRGY